MSARRTSAFVGSALATIVLPVLAVGETDRVPSDDLSALVAAERGFAATSVESGMRTAFLDWLAEDSIVFRPQAVDGRSYFEASPEAPGALLWEPAFAEVSPAGDMGWTSGRYESRRSGPEGDTLQHGRYLTIWRRQADGAWKVALDTGVPDSCQ